MRRQMRNIAGSDLHPNFVVVKKDAKPWLGLWMGIILIPLGGFLARPGFYAWREERRLQAEEKKASKSSPELRPSPNLDALKSAGGSALPISAPKTTMVELECPLCGGEVKVTRALQGKPMRCTHCYEQFEVPMFE